MVKIIQPGLCLVEYLLDDVAVGQVAFDACKLFVKGLLPMFAGIFHAVAGHAENGVSGSMITRNGEKSDCNAENYTCSEYLYTRLIKVFLRPHASTPYTKNKWGKDKNNRDME